MKYFYNESTGILLSMDNGEITEYKEMTMGAGGVAIKVKRAKKEREDPADEPAAGNRRRLTPETIEKIEDMLKAGDSVTDICTETGVSNPTVYMIRSRLRAAGDLPGE